MIKINGVVIEQNHFPDGTLLLKDQMGTVYYPCMRFEWLYESDAELFTLICLAKKYSNKSKTLYLPYIPHARQDRVKSYEDTFTLKYFAEVINSLGFESVHVLDPHSNVSAALIDRVYAQRPQAYLEDVIFHYQVGGNPESETINDDFVLFFPDEGASKRYSSLLSEVPYAFGIKQRDWKTGQIQGLSVIDNGIDLKGKTILIVDDICSRGGTFYHSAKKLKELGVGDIYLYVTHCENTILEGELLTSGLIKRVFTTNSIFTKTHEMIEVMEV